MTHTRPLTLASVFASLLAAALAACGDVSVPDGPRCTSTQSSKLLAISQSPDPDAGEAHLIGQCLEHAPTLRADGTASCLVLEARKTGSGCTCDAAQGRSNVTAAHAPAIDLLETSAETGHTAWDCFCEINQISPASDDGKLCQTSAESPLKAADGHEPQGYCYVDPAVTASNGNPEVVKNCPATEKRQIRFTGAPFEAGADSTLAIICESEVCDAPAAN